MHVYVCHNLHILHLQTLLSNATYKVALQSPSSQFVWIYINHILNYLLYPPEWLLKCQINRFFVCFKCNNICYMIVNMVIYTISSLVLKLDSHLEKTYACISFLACLMLLSVGAPDGAPGVAGRCHPDLLLAVRGLRRSDRLLQLQPSQVSHPCCQPSAAIYGLFSPLVCLSREKRGSKGHG